MDRWKEAFASFSCLSTQWARSPSVVTVLKYSVLIESLSYGKETVQMTTVKKIVHYSQFPGEEGHAGPGEPHGSQQPPAGGSGRGGNWAQVPLLWLPREGMGEQGKQAWHWPLWINSVGSRLQGIGAVWSSLIPGPGEWLGQAQSGLEREPDRERAWGGGRGLGGSVG